MALIISHWFVYLLIIFEECWASTHWIVTEDGRIQPQLDSVFSLKRPYDLVALMQQEKRAVLIEELKQQLMAQKEEIDRREDKETNLEGKIYATDEDCIAAEKPLTDFDLYASTVVPFPPYKEFGDEFTEFADKMDLNIDFKKPNCTEVVDLDFSMHSFEHLHGVRDRHNLTMSAEVGLHHAVTTVENIELYGHLVHEFLQKTMGSTFRHKHLYTFHKFWDINGDGVLTWEDFRQLAEKYTKIQRRGKLDQDVFKRWESILGKWWDELTHHADFNKDAVVEFDEWLKFFSNLGAQTKSHKELPDFLQTYLQLFFFIMDTNKDGLFCLKDYKKYLTAHNMDVNRAKECFETMVNDEDRANGNAMTSDRFRELVYDFWVSQNPNSPGMYICGTFDSAMLEELESMSKKK